MSLVLNNDLIYTKTNSYQSDRKLNFACQSKLDSNFLPIVGNFKSFSQSSI